MTCSDSQILFTDYLDGQVPAPLRRDFEAHLRLCQECAERLRGVRMTRDRLASLERQRLPDTFGFRIRRLLLEELAHEQRWSARLRELVRPIPQVAWSAAIGSVAATVIFTAFWFALRPGTGSELRNVGVARTDSLKREKSVRYVLEHLPLEGDLIESTAHDTASLATPPTTPSGAQPVSASF